MSSASTASKSFGGECADCLSKSSADDKLQRLYNNIVPPSQLPQKANYYLFKVRIALDSPDYLLRTHDSIQEGIIPAWEDEANKYGGKWSIQLPRDKNRSNIDKMWLYTVRKPTSRASVL